MNSDNSLVVVRRLKRALGDLGIRPQVAGGEDWVGVDSDHGQVVFHAVGIADASRLANFLEDLAAHAERGRSYFPPVEVEPEEGHYEAQSGQFTPVTAPHDPPYPASQYHPRVGL
ncbi:MAG: hypothetical protein NTZ76_06685 [Actinobacteria bacterium]|nr:hypothetical protein [Actinomycetota bacterium]